MLRFRRLLIGLAAAVIAGSLGVCGLCHFVEAGGNARDDSCCGTEAIYQGGYGARGRHACVAKHRESRRE